MCKCNPSCDCVKEQPKKIEMGKKYKTERDGFDVEILAIGAGLPTGDVIGLIKYSHGNGLLTWNQYGVVIDRNYMGRGLDLVEVKEKKEGWINICSFPHNKTASICFHLTKEEADIKKCNDRVACIPISWEEYLCQRYRNLHLK